MKRPPEQAGWRPALHRDRTVSSYSDPFFLDRVREEYAKCSWVDASTLKEIDTEVGPFPGDVVKLARDDRYTGARVHDLFLVVDQYISEDGQDCITLESKYKNSSGSYTSLWLPKWIVRRDFYLLPPEPTPTRHPNAWFAIGLVGFVKALAEVVEDPTYIRFSLLELD